MLAPSRAGWGISCVALVVGCTVSHDRPLGDGGAELDSGVAPSSTEPDPGGPSCIAEGGREAFRCLNAEGAEPTRLVVTEYGSEEIGPVIICASPRAIVCGGDVSICSSVPDFIDSSCFTAPWLACAAGTTRCLNGAVPRCAWLRPIGASECARMHAACTEATRCAPGHTCDSRCSFEPPPWEGDVDLATVELAP